MSSLSVTIPHNDVRQPADIKPAEEIHAVKKLQVLPAKQLTVLPLNGCEGVDNARQQKPPASSEKQFTPAVAQLFSSVVSSKKCSIHDDVSELLDVHPKGIELSNFCRVFEMCFHRPFDSRRTDVDSLLQMFESMDDIVAVNERDGEVIVSKKLGCDYLQGNAPQLLS